MGISSYACLQRIRTDLTAESLLSSLLCGETKTNTVCTFIDSVERVLRELQQMQHDAGIVASKTSLSVELEKIASDKGFIVSDNEGSGNCMFYALSEQLNLVKGIQISHAELRQRLVQYLKDNPTLVSWCFYSVCQVIPGSFH